MLEIIMKKRDPKEYESAGKFLAGLGVVCLILPIFLHASLGQSLHCIASGLIAVGAGSGMISSARKRKRQELKKAKKNEQRDA